MAGKFVLNEVVDKQNIPRRTFLTDIGMGFTGLALTAMLRQDGFGAEAGGWQPPDVKAHFAPKVKSVIWLFTRGGVIHMGSFDPKPMLDKYAGKTIKETPCSDVQDSERLKKVRVVVVNDANAQQRNELNALQVGCKKYRQNGIEVSDWFPRISLVIDDIAVIRSLWKTDHWKFQEKSGWESTTEIHLRSYFPSFIAGF